MLQSWASEYNSKKQEAVVREGGRVSQGEGGVGGGRGTLMHGVPTAVRVEFISVVVGSGGGGGGDGARAREKRRTFFCRRSRLYIVKRCWRRCKKGRNPFNRLEQREMVYSDSVEFDDNEPLRWRRRQ